MNFEKTLLILYLLVSCTAHAEERITVFSPARVFDGDLMHTDWLVAISGSEIVYAGSSADLPQLDVDSRIDLPGQTLMPGLIEGHSHVLLHPYNETSWNDQVLKESEAERVARAVNHVYASLMAGVTTMRDLGSEGAGFADVGIRDSIDKGIVPGPRLLVAGKALVATGSYGPKGFHEHVNPPLGAQEADGFDALARAVREQIGRGVDLIKVYADYRWGPGGVASPTYTQAELETIVAITASSGRPVVAHAVTAEGMRRAVLAGVETIEHGDGGTQETFRLMRENGVALCPTLAAGDAISQYGGWHKGVDPEPERVVQKRKSFRAALDAGVTICFGGDVGVFPHGDNVRELEMMVEYGMKPMDALRAATSVNARIFHLSDSIGQLRAGLQADIISVDGDPGEHISALRNPRLVVKSGRIYRRE